MPILPNAQNFSIHNSQFTDNSTNNTTNTTINVNGPTGIDILLEASCPQAAHDSSARSYPPRCFPGTREQYIEDIVAWVIPTLGNTPPPIYWMKGPAGVGKSAIAQTCSEELERTEKLGAAFFFSVGGRDNPQTFFPSIAYQLSTIHPPYRELIDRKLRLDKTLVNKALSFQFQYLIDRPLRELASQGKGIGGRTAIIVDGLDECEGPGPQAEIIRIVARAASDGALPLCWAFFSRPEPHIEATFAEPDIAPLCLKALLPISGDEDGEIELYLRNGFENILKCRNASVESLWPSVEDMTTLVGAAHGSFIYATTVLRFVDHLSPPGPQKRLRITIDAILDRRKRGPDAGTGANTPFAELDAFYMLILQRIPTEIFASVHLLLVLICQYGKLGVIFAANILALSKDEFETVCNHASAVVHLQDPGKDLELDLTIDTNCTYAQVNRGILQKLRMLVVHELGGMVAFYHKSFNDFLLDPARSGSYCTKSSEALAKHYLKMHLDYDRTYCWEGSELVLARGVTDFGSSLSYPYTNELVSSLIKARVYIEFGSQDSESFSAPGVFGVLGGSRDFRKRLHVVTSLVSYTGTFPGSDRMWGCACRFKSYPGTQIAWASLAEFHVNEFKLVVKQYKQANILQRYQSSWPSRVKSLFLNQFREHFESAVYRMGHGEKSIFWYWEIDYELGHYRQFRTTDLVEGEKRFREEDFDAWPEWEA